MVVDEIADIELVKMKLQTSSWWNDVSGRSEHHGLGEMRVVLGDEIPHYVAYKF